MGTEEKPLFYDGGFLFLESTNCLNRYHSFPNISLMGTQKPGTQKKIKNNENQIWKTRLAGVGLLCIWAYCFEVVLSG